MWFLFCHALKRQAGLVTKTSFDCHVSVTFEIHNSYTHEARC